MKVANRLIGLFSSVVLASVCLAAPQNCNASFTDCNGIVTTVQTTCRGCLPIVPDGQCFNHVTYRNAGAPNECIQSLVIQCIACPENSPPGGGGQ